MAAPLFLGEEQVRQHLSMAKLIPAMKQALEIHHYDPYDYTINPSGPCLAWGTPYTQYSQCSWAQENYHTDLFNQIRAKWVAAGVPVIIGEYGVARRSNQVAGAREYYLETVTRTAQNNGIKMFYWDNGAQSGASDVFALFDRNSGSIVDSGGLNAIMRGVGGTSTSYALAVTRSGSGSGTVASSPSGINCGSTCNASFSSGTSVTLTATAATGSTFGGWSGACSGTSTSCTVSMSAARNVTAAFNSSTTSFTLTVTKAGSGSGTVTANTGAINCGSTCSGSYSSGTSVTLTASAASGATFAGWSGACTGTSTCTVSMTQARSVTATFNTASTFALSITRAGTGSGTVTSNPAASTAASTCTANYSSGASVTLTAAAASGSTFAGWSGACSGTGNCTVVDDGIARGDRHVQHEWRNGRHVRERDHVHEQHGQLQYGRSGVLPDQPEHRRLGLLELRWTYLNVGGVARSCGQLPLSRASDGHYYFSVTAGTYPWASLYVW